MEEQSEPVHLGVGGRVQDDVAPKVLRLLEGCMDELVVGDPALLRIRRLADELDTPVHMHLHETRTEVEDSIRLGLMA